MKLAVPYYSQFLDIQDPYWMLRACGAASFKMVTEFHGLPVIDMITFCNDAKERGGYDMKNGWVHEYLITKAQELGLQAERKEGLVSIDEILVSLDVMNPVIVSVEKHVLEQTRFHMVVLVGYEFKTSDDERMMSDDILYYHEPESTDNDRGQYRSCTVETFMNYWRGKAIFISKS